MIKSMTAFARVQHSDEYGTLTWAGLQVIRAFRGWSWVLLIVGLAIRHLNRTNRFLDYANTGVLPFYVLHQPVILGIGYYVVQWNVPIMLKYAVIVASAFSVVMLVYEFAVRRVPPLRYVFGIGRKKKTPAANSPA